MKDEKCISCSEYKNCKDSFTSWVIFIVGIIATLAIRGVTVLIHVSPIYGKLAWYVGVCGFFVFFIYKFRVSQARSKLINHRKLIDKIANQKQLTQEDYTLISAILCGVSSKKERINYFFIFSLSVVALILAIYMDFLR